jgi:demethylmenaquinone methyltransferase/2-methoxy-6-polyprenyl-1,4-benzoquinol methylase
MNLKTFFMFKKAYSGQLLWPVVLYGRKPLFKQMAFEAAQTLAKGWVLDIGTGPAHLPIGIAKDCKNINAIGLDVSSSILYEAAKKIKDKTYSSRIHLVTSQAEHLPFIDDAFETIQSMFSFHLWNDQNLGIREIYRVLKPGGQAVILVGRQHLLHGFWSWFYFLTNRPTFDLRNMCMKAGFSEVEINPFKQVIGGIRISLTK